MDLSDVELIKLKRSFHNLKDYVERRKYKGYDPYDVLTSVFPFRKLGKWPPIIAIQITKRNPLNFRKILGVPKMWNPKALGLFLQGYSLLPKSEDNKAKCEWLFEKLLELQSPGVPGMGWGYPFPWASPEKYLAAWSPTSVVSGFVAQGLDAYYRAYADPRALDALEKTCIFLSEGLVHTERDEFYAISYSTVKPDFCYNASLLAAQTYALTYALTGAQIYADIARKALETVLSRQKSDGSWNYSEHLETGKQRVQIDFHQGFVLDSIMSISERLGLRDESIERALQDGFEFYRDQQFASTGRALWRLPGNFPTDIHHQAQGILTSIRYERYSKSRRAEALGKSVLIYTLTNFQDSRGYFYYRKHKTFTDRTSYMRWGNAWMFLAMADSLKAAQDRE
jgi:hypothetical protein